MVRRFIGDRDVNPKTHRVADPLIVETGSTTSCLDIVGRWDCTSQRIGTILACFAIYVGSTVFCAGIGTANFGGMNE